MGTKLNNIELMGKEIKDTLTDFLLNHSRIEPVRYEEVCYFTPEGGHSYSSLDDAGRKVQSALSKRYERFSSAMRSLLKDQPDDVLAKMSKLNDVLERTIGHKLTWCENTQEALHRALAALEDQIKLVKAVYEKKSRKE